MKLSIQDENDLMHVYDSWWHSYLNGDVKTYDSYFAEDYRFIGSTNNEDYLNRKDTTKFFEDTSEQLAGKAELRNLERTINVITKDLVLFTDLANAYVLSGSEWIFYSRFRFTSLIKKNKDGWRFTYQHFSAPDNKAQEGETLGTEQISKENRELRDAIKRRTVELEQSNKELAIEAALERVRARTMAMQHSNELQDAAFLMFQQAETLGISVFGCGFNIWDEDKKASTAWMAGENRIQPPFKTSSSEDIFVRIHAASKKGDLLFIEEQGGAVLQNHYKYMSSIPVFKNIVHKMSENGHSLPDFQIMHCAFFSHGYLMFISFEPVPNAYDIFKRFAKVFEQTYTRFLDLKKAEAQAREAQIEAAIERVRSRTIAMQNSDELQEASFLLDEQVRGLGIKTWGCAFNIYGEKESTEWFGNEAGVLPTYKVPRAGIFKEYYQQGQKGESLLIKEFSGDECVTHYEYMSSLPIIGDVLKNLKETNNGFPTYQIDHVVYFKYGYLLFITREHVPEAYDIFKRFAKVFEQTYTRFLDLQKAEAQAREAQIEASLERVRAQSMGMHSSQELKDVIRVIFDQMGQININAEHAGIVVNYEPKKDWHFWVAETQDIPAKITVPYLDSIWDRQFTEAKQNNKALFTTLLNFEEKNAFYKKLLPYIEGLTKEMEDHYFKSNGLAASTALQKDIGLYIENFSGTPYTDEENSILLRFAKVFQQTYTRFLDLQKAEAQAREAQIEMSLERVRARAMAMHHTDELTDVLCVLFDQFDFLGINPVLTHLTLMDEENETFQLRITSSAKNRVVADQYIDVNAVEAWRNSFANWKNSAPNTVDCIDYEPSMLPDVWELLKEVMDALPKGHKIYPKDFPEGLYTTQGHFKFGYIGFNHSRRATEEEKSIVERFAREFGRTYQRFLDLQKAEAQARESQIEAALEKVRSRSLAMHVSTEMQEVANEIREQLLFLGLKIDALAMSGVIDNESDYDVWVGGANSQKPLRIPYNNDTQVQRDFNKAIKERPELFTKTYKGKVMKAYFKHLMASNSFNPEIEHFMLYSKAFTTTLTFMKNSGIQIIRYNDEVFSDEDNTIVKRFGKVFEQAYIRFLDLQKAEAQAREAQIVASLERVRATTMAMHQSNELSAVLSTLFEQYDILGINPSHAVLTLINKENNTLNFRTTGKNGYQVISEQEVDLNLYDTWIDTAEKWKKSNPNAVNVNEYSPEVLPDVWEVYKDILNSMPKKARPEIKDFPEGLFITEGYCQFGYIGFAHSRKPTEEEKDIVRRFAAEFGSLYQRFLDLKKAEAQAREAQIENALEKVRSRTMAMQKSEELPEAANNLFLQLQELGLPAWSAGYCIWQDEKKNASCNMSTEGLIQKSFVLPSIGEGYDFYTPSLSDKSFHIHELGGEALVKHYEFMVTLPVVGEILDGIIKSGLSLPTFQIFHIVYFKYGYVMFITYESMPHAHDIFKRFGKVFEQTYTRFLDLQKAEKQAREAQIEHALEKVRSQTMAMQKGEDIKDVVVLLYKELISLGVTNFASCGYVEINEETSKQETWVTNPGGDSLGLFYLPLTGDVHFDERYKAWKKQQTVFHQTVAGKERKKHLEYAITKFNSKEAEEMVLTQFPDPTVFYCFNFSHGYLHLVSGSYLKEDEEALLARFTRVFEQTYARFLDLQKAEAQTREAQINLAVERVRAKALAMHKSEEIINVVAKLKDEVMSLDIPDVVAATIFLNEGDDKVRMWDLSSIEVNDNHSEIPFDLTFKIKKTDPHFYVKRVWENPADYFVEIQDEQGFKRLMQWLRELDKNKKEVADEVEDFIEKTQLKRLYHVVRKLNNGKLVIDLLNPPSNEMETILTKMGAAFDLAYKRFEDLKKAEAQTKEARIEAALERVRSRSMAMHKSEELLDVISVVSEQLIQLDFKFIHVSFANNDISKDYKFWTAYKGMVKPIRFNTPYLDIAMFNNLRKAQKNSMAFFTDILTNEEHIQWHQHLLKHGGSKIFSKEENDYIMSRGMARSIAINPNIMLILANYASIPYSEEENKIISRFGKVFEQSYTRFLDLQKAESQAKETEIELALERIRARTMAMHKSSELGEVAAVLFEQISTLNDTPSRFNIAIINDEDKSFDIWLTDQSGKNVNQQFIFHSDKSPVVNEIFKAWKTKKNHIIQDLHGKKLEEWIRYSSIEVGVPFDKSQVKKHRYISSICFKNGFIGITTDVHPKQDEIQLLERFTKVFEQTYTRFLDLEKAEAQAMIAEQNLINLKTEKKRAEDALKELQHTQKQLIQSEKMASLGELTAGIAHEIQNPLNFVNNFSEVSTELIDEMNEEIEKGDLEEVKFIMADIKLNLEKINHHGRRADAIVKGMLQHSRTSSAKKEPTDINKLADEYFRLAYHGLRAKDKTFNAKLETAYDKTIGKVSVIPQDMGRVILNLITNAFYVVDEKKKSGTPNYEPTVILSTKKQKNKITVSVKDNGNGIPKNALDKIFQPFFTTKPTGQGTGLGLSMSYDIVTKGHNGELKAKTEQDVGSEFIISLPI